MKKLEVVINRPQLTPEQLQLSTEEFREHLKALLEKPTISTDGLSTEQQRSVVNQKLVCRCGTTKKMSFQVDRIGKSHTRSKVYIGGKRRMPCKECAGCKAPKCNKCKFCLQAHLKKSCEQRKCLFPKIPQCPCFA
jgi:hypothetical protein